MCRRSICRDETPKLVSEMMTPSRNSASELLDARGDVRVACHAQVGPQQGRVGAGEKAATHDAGDDRQPQLARERRHLVLEPEAAHFDAHHQHRRARRIEPREDVVDARCQRVGIDRFGRQLGHLGAGCVHHVAREFDVDRSRFGPAAGERARDARRRALRVVEAHLVAGDLAIDPVLRVERLGLVVQQQPGPRFALAGRPRDDHHRRAFRIGARDRVDHVERARAVGHRGNAEGAVDARGRVGRKPDRRLVTQRVQREYPRLLDHLEKGQGEIAGDAENLLRAVTTQRMKQGFGQFHRREGAFANERGAPSHSDAKHTPIRARLVFSWRAIPVWQSPAAAAPT